MLSIWLTYCWADNDTGDVDYVAQELRKRGVEVRLDKYQLAAGQRLWDQISAHITDRKTLDAWLLYTTEASLKSEACREELAYALDRALSPAKETAGKKFPLIGLFPAPLDSDLIPPAIRTRLYVSLTDPDWIQRVIAGAEGKAPAMASSEIGPIGFKSHVCQGFAAVIEVWPRAGSLEPFFYCVPVSEAFPEGAQQLVFAGRGKVPSGPSGMLTNYAAFRDVDIGLGDGSRWSGERTGTAATPSTSAFIFCPHAPTRMYVGEDGGHRVELVFSGT